MEETEDFIIQLSLSGGDVEMGTILLVQSEAVVSIEDDDSEFTTSPPPHTHTLYSPIVPLLAGQNQWRSQKGF